MAQRGVWTSAPAECSIDKRTCGFPAGFLILKNPAIYAGCGADDGNRTHTASLGSWSSTIKLHLQTICIIIIFLIKINRKIIR